MSEPLTDLFCKRIEAAGRTYRWGIGRASNYLTHMDVDEELRKDRAAQLVYADEDCLIRKPGEVAYELTGQEVEGPDGTKSAVLRPLQVKAAKEPTAGAVMDFASVLTSSRIDRDGDRLEPRGARVDMRGPLLWNHLSTDPIGKMLAIVQQNGKRLAMRFSIADTELGRDIAQLMEFGALQRMSHGFIPTKYEEMTTKEGDFNGWHVQEYDILEASVVSVASNVDAVITVMSRSKLHHPLVKGWAGKLFDARPVIVPGADIDETPETKTATDVEDDMASLGDAVVNIKLNLDRSELDAAIEDKEALEKAGRSLSKANERRITDSRDDCLEIASMDSVPRAAKALADNASERLSEILATLTTDEDDGKDVEAGEEKAAEPPAKPAVDLEGLKDAARTAASGAIAQATKR